MILPFNKKNNFLRKTEFAIPKYSLKQESFLKLTNDHVLHQK
jgi:hypothetical protein